MRDQDTQQKDRYGKLPIAHTEDVEYSEELADEADREAVERAEAAELRQEGN